MFLSAYVPNDTQAGEILVKWSLDDKDVEVLSGKDGVWVLLILAVWTSRRTKMVWHEVERRLVKIGSSGPKPVVFRAKEVGPHSVIGAVLYSEKTGMPSPKKWLMAKPWYTDGEYRDLLVDDDWSGIETDNPFRKEYQNWIFDDDSEKRWLYAGSPVAKGVAINESHFIAPTWDWKYLHLFDGQPLVRTTVGLWRRRIKWWVVAPLVVLAFSLVMGAILVALVALLMNGFVWRAILFAIPIFCLYLALWWVAGLAKARIWRLCEPVIVRRRNRNLLRCRN